MGPDGHWRRFGHSQPLCNFKHMDLEFAGEELVKLSIFLRIACDVNFATISAPVGIVSNVINDENSCYDIWEADDEDEIDDEDEEEDENICPVCYDSMENMMIYLILLKE